MNGHAYGGIGHAMFARPVSQKWLKDLGGVGKNRNVGMITLQICLTSKLVPGTMVMKKTTPLGKVASTC